MDNKIEKDNLVNIIKRKKSWEICFLLAHIFLWPAVIFGTILDIVENIQKNDNSEPYDFFEIKLYFVYIPVVISIFVSLLCMILYRKTTKEGSGK